MNEKLKKILKKIGKITAIIIGLLVGAIVALYLLGWGLIFLWYLAFDYPKISFKEFLEIDACIDCGGCWDYNHHRCETKDKEAIITWDSVISKNTKINRKTGEYSFKAKKQNIGELDIPQMAVVVGTCKYE